MKLNDLIDFIESRVPYTYFKNIFPKDSIDNSAYVRFSGGTPTRQTGVSIPTFQVVVRSSSEEIDLSEDVSNKIYDELTNLSEVLIGNSSVVEIRCKNSIPLFLGSDELGRHIHSINFEMTVRP